MAKFFLSLVAIGVAVLIGAIVFATFRGRDPFLRMPPIFVRPKRSEQPPCDQSVWPTRVLFLTIQQTERALLMQRDGNQRGSGIGSSKRRCHPFSGISANLLSADPVERRRRGARPSSRASH